MPKFNNFPGRPGRNPFWNYDSYGVYFITINTFDRVPYFGQIDQGKLWPSPAGKIVNTVWGLIPEQFAFVRTDEFVVMPDHIHGILIVHGSPPEVERSPKQDKEQPIPPPSVGGVTGLNNPMLGKNLSRVVRWFKGRCTFEIRRVMPEFTWQSHFDDRVLAHDEAWIRTRIYIRENPLKWGGGRDKSRPR